MIKPLLLLVSAIITVTCIESCYVAKPLDREVKISINTADFPIVITNTGTSNFSGKHTEAEYRKYYVEELTRELNADHIIIDESAPEFIIKITSLEMSESTKTDTVKDVKSKDNGLVRDLTSAKLKTMGTVMKVGSTQLFNWDAEKEDAEKLTNNTNVEQLIKGQNTTSEPVWREKGFDDAVYLTQSAYCGRRAGVRITQEIKLLLK